MMVLKNLFTALIGLMLLAGSGLARADGYKPDEFLGLDLSKAVLSPKPLGPPTQFAPLRVEAKTELGSDAKPVRVERVTRPKARVADLQNQKRVVEKRHTAKQLDAKQLNPKHLDAKHMGPVRTRLAHSHRSPLDAQARDTRIQVWPCKSGGICNWKH
jgi:hypothetical protein